MAAATIGSVTRRNVPKEVLAEDPPRPPRGYGRSPRSGVEQIVTEQGNEQISTWLSTM